MRFSKWSASLVPLGAIVVLGLAVGSGGCGPSTPQHDKSADYTPQALADELAFRLSGLSDGKPQGPEATKSDVSGIEDQARSSTVAEATKKAPEAQTVDDVVNDIAAKARTIQETPFGDVCRQVADLLRKNASVPEARKQAAITRLETLAAQP
jgi:hypothetical protein